MKIKHTSNRTRRVLKVPEQPVVPKPDRRKLKGLYRALLLKPSEEMKIETLRVALKWYDQAFEWLQYDRHKKQELTVEIYKAIEQVHAIRERAGQVNDPPTRIKHLREAIELYEKTLMSMLCSIPNGIRPVAEIFDILAKVDVVQARKAARYAKQYSSVVEEMFAAFKPVNARGEPLMCRVSDMPDVNGKSHKPRWTSKDMRTLNYTLKHAKQMFRTVRKEGWLQVVIEEVQWLAYYALSVYDHESEQLKFVHPHVGDAIKKLMENVRRYAMANRKFAGKLFRVRRKKVKA